MSVEHYKRTVAKVALRYLANEKTIGIGTGSTVEHFIHELASFSKAIIAVSSSDKTTALLQSLGIEVIPLNSVNKLTLYIDGADEATCHRQLIKGGGGALTREKIIAAASQHFLCLADETKLVSRLGRFPLPIEVIPMAQSYVAREIVALGGMPILRQGMMTDNKNIILDVHNLDIVSPNELEMTFNQIPGVVSCGLFARRPADLLLVAGKKGVREFGSL